MTKICDGKLFKMTFVSKTDFKIWDRNRLIDENRINELIEMYKKNNYNLEKI